MSTEYCFQLFAGKSLRLNIDKTDRTQLNVLAHMLKGQLFEHETSLFVVHTVGPGDVVVDVGANIGYFALLSALLVGDAGKVVAIEANPKNVPLLAANVALNSASQVAIEPIAVSDQPGQVVFWSHHSDSDGGIRAGRALGEELDNEFVVSAERLEVVAARQGLDRIKLLKIDTEGHELHVLQGFETYLARHAVDFIVCELNLPGLAERGVDQHQLRAYVSQFGYETFLYDHDGKLPMLVPPGITIEQYYTSNILFARPADLAPYWRSVRNDPAAIKIAD
jgi:FkbM family methyltransferase